MKYADFRNNLDIHPVTGDLLLHVDDNAIANQIRNLIFFDFYEVPWMPELGAGVPQTLFENAGFEAEYKIRVRITEAIERHAADRAILNDVIISYDNANAYKVTIVFTPINKLDPIEINLLLTRTR